MKWFRPPPFADSQLDIALWNVTTKYLKNDAVLSFLGFFLTVLQGMNNFNGFCSNQYVQYCFTWFTWKFNWNTKIPVFVWFLQEKFMQSKCYLKFSINWCNLKSQVKSTYLYNPKKKCRTNYISESYKIRSRVFFFHKRFIRDSVDCVILHFLKMSEMRFLM